MREGLDWHLELLDLEGPDSEARTEALLTAAFLSFHAARMNFGYALAQQAEKLAIRLGNEEARARAIRQLAPPRHHEGYA